MGHKTTISVTFDSLPESKEDLRREREQLIKLKAFIESLVGDCDRSLSLFTNTANAVYNVEWSWSKKARFIIRENGRPMTLQHILDYAELMYEDDLTSDEGAYSKTKSNLSGQLKANLDRLFMRTKFEYKSKYYYYGLKEWFDDDGELLPEFQPEWK